MIFTPFTPINPPINKSTVPIVRKRQQTLDPILVKSYTPRFVVPEEELLRTLKSDRKVSSPLSSLPGMGDDEESSTTKVDDQVDDQVYPTASNQLEFADKQFTNFPPINISAATRPSV